MQELEEVAHGYLFLITNDKHQEPYGLLEDLFVSPTQRLKGYARELINKIITRAKEEKCYKLIATSRHSKPEVHEVYKKLGFNDHGLEFRMDLMKTESKY